MIKSILKRLTPKFIKDNDLYINILYRIKFYFFLRNKLKKQLHFPNFKINTIKTSGLKCLVPIIETSHYQYLQILILAKALQLRGVDVKVLICGQTLDACELKSIKNHHTKNPCFNCRFNQTHILKLFDLPYIKLNDILSEPEINDLGNEAFAINESFDCTIERYGVNLNTCIEDSVVRYYYGALPTDTNEIKKVRLKNIKTALTNIEVAKRIHEEWSPDIVLSNMTSYSTWEPYYRFFRNKGTFRQISMSQFNFHSLILNSFELFPAQYRFNRYKLTRQNPKLSCSEREKLNDFLKKRFIGDASIFIQDGYFKENMGNYDLKSSLRLNEAKRNIFLFSNLYWDIGLSERSSLFQSVIEWVVSTIELVKDNDNVHLYIKPHPAEIFGAGSLKGMSEIISGKYPDGLKNITIIQPELKIKTYDLFPFIDLGVIFTGTLGLEMMLSNIPVVSTGMTSHLGLGFSVEPNSIEEYTNVLNNKYQVSKIDRDELELFAYFYFIRTLIPWHLTKQVYADDFNGFNFKSLDHLIPGMDPHLDHLCNCILDPLNMVPEAWPDEEDLEKRILHK